MFYLSFLHQTRGCLHGVHHTLFFFGPTLLCGSTYSLHPPSHVDLRAVRREVSAQLSPNTFSSIANRSSPGEKHNLLFPSKHSRRWEKWCKYYSSRAVIAFFASINTILTMKYNISTGCAVVDWKLYLFSFRMSRAQSRSSTIPN